MWDKESVELIGKHAAAYNQGDDVQTFPPEVDTILANKSALFKVNVVPQDRSSDTIFPVLKLETDREIINKVRGISSAQAEPSQVSKPSEQAANSNEVDSCTNENATPSESISNMGKTVEHCDDDVTIAKSLIDEFSTTMPKKKLKRLKQEKY